MERNLLQVYLLSKWAMLLPTEIYQAYQANPL